MMRLVFVDEQPDDIDSFKDYVDANKAGNPIEVVALYPRETLVEMIQAVLESHPDALITDFMLNEYKVVIEHNIPYNGVDLVQEFLKVRKEFPTFVMTAWDDEAINKSDDVNIVYIKNILHGGERDSVAKVNFLHRIISQVEHHRARIATSETRLFQLQVLRDSGKATIEDENELIELDQFLELSIDGRSSIPAQYKTLSNTSRLQELLLKVDDLVKKLDDER